MSDTPQPDPDSPNVIDVDLTKVTQMLDNGWDVRLFRNEMGSYTAAGRHADAKVWHRAKAKWTEGLWKGPWSVSEAEHIADEDFCTVGVVDTDDFTPERALTRLAYKVYGELIEMPPLD